MQSAAGACDRTSTVAFEKVLHLLGIAAPLAYEKRRHEIAPISSYARHRHHALRQWRMAAILRHHFSYRFYQNLTFNACIFQVAAFHLFPSELKKAFPTLEKRLEMPKSPLTVAGPCRICAELPFLSMDVMLFLGTCSHIFSFVVSKPYQAYRKTCLASLTLPLTVYSLSAARSSTQRKGS